MATVLVSALMKSCRCSVFCDAWLASRRHLKLVQLGSIQIDWHNE